MLSGEKWNDWKAQVGMFMTTFDIHLQTLPWVFCPGPSVVRGNGRAYELAGKATEANDSRLGMYEMLRSLSSYGHQSRHRSLGGERCSKRTHSTVFLEKTGNGQRQSYQYRTRFRGSIGKNVHRQSEARVGFSE